MNNVQKTILKQSAILTKSINCFDGEFDLPFRFCVLSAIMRLNWEGYSDRAGLMCLECYTIWLDYMRSVHYCGFSLNRVMYNYIMKFVFIYFCNNLLKCDSNNIINEWVSLIIAFVWLIFLFKWRFIYYSYLILIIFFLNIMNYKFLKTVNFENECMRL